ncbi:MAG: hypothetical protein CVV27_17990, partial [Candidatus Melainabacteria bacterium HGW-Melainabacteria-1]
MPLGVSLTGFFLSALLFRALNKVYTICMKVMILTQKNRLRLSDEEHRLVKAMSYHCARLYNVGLYHVLQHFFGCGEYLNYVKNAPQCYANENYRMLHTDIGQQVLRKVDHNFN